VLGSRRGWSRPARSHLRNVAVAAEPLAGASAGAGLEQRPGSPGNSTYLPLDPGRVAETDALVFLRDLG
jgi:hypothetical protein